MAVRSKRIKGDIGDDSQFGNGFLDRSRRLVDQIVGIKNVGTVIIAQRMINIGKCRDRGNSQCACTFGFIDNHIDRQPVDTGHTVDRLAFAFAPDDEYRPDQVIWRDRVFGDHVAQPRGTGANGAYGGCW